MSILLWVYTMFINEPRAWIGLVGCCDLILVTVSLIKKTLRDYS
ncbi:hypothetical protein AO364_1706 [Moraxella catarrhalis]|nr:hypothetical protein AO364_1706 [Moraxella catarrhalis]